MSEFCEAGSLQTCPVTGRPILGLEAMSIKDYPGERWCWWRCAHCGGWHLCSCQPNGNGKGNYEQTPETALFT